jgi:hypothetical protein
MLLLLLLHVSGASPDGKRIQEDWKVVLGELALDVRTGNLAAAADAAGAHRAG